MEPTAFGEVKVAVSPDVSGLNQEPILIPCEEATTTMGYRSTASSRPRLVKKRSLRSAAYELTTVILYDNLTPIKSLICHLQHPLLDNRI